MIIHAGDPNSEFLIGDCPVLPLAGPNGLAAHPFGPTVGAYFFPLGPKYAVFTGNHAPELNGEATQRKWILSTALRYSTSRNRLYGIPVVISMNSRIQYCTLHPDSGLIAQLVATTKLLRRPCTVEQPVLNRDSLQSRTRNEDRILRLAEGSRKSLESQTQ